METAVAGIIIFGPALRAHDEFLHRSVRTIVGERLDDAKAGATIRAVGKRLQITPVIGIENLTQTILAGGNVRQHQSGFGATAFALANFKPSIPKRVEPGSLKALDEAAWRFFLFEPEKELPKPGLGAFNFDENTLGGIPDPPLQIQFCGKPEDKRTKTNSLDGAPNG